MERQSKWSKILQIRDETQRLLDEAYLTEQKALNKLEKADKLMTEAAIHLNYARRTEEVSNMRQKKLDQAFVKLNKARALIDRRGVEQSEHDLFLLDNIAHL